MDCEFVGTISAACRGQRWRTPSLEGWNWGSSVRRPEGHFRDRKSLLLLQVHTHHREEWIRALGPIRRFHEQSSL